MRVIKYPQREAWAQLCQRPEKDYSELNNAVAAILADVKQRGDDAIYDYETRFDGAQLQCLEVSDEEKHAAMEAVDGALIDAIDTAHNNIKTFHEAQRFESRRIETMRGVTCWQKSIAIERVGLYVPGGTAPLFSTVLMLATPAVIAGCKEVVICTPPNKHGRVNDAILVAASIAGIKHVYKVGGVQAIGAMAYGTQSIPKVYKIFGPGNQYVMAAKQQVSLHDVAIDMPAGPSEVCVIADDKASVPFIAADLLSQAEHGIDSQVVLVTTTEEMVSRVMVETARQLQALPRRDIAQKALENSIIVLVNDTNEAVDFANTYAPEHLIIQADDWAELAEKVVNAGSVFLGRYACESVGDYASGTNHTLPTHGWAVSHNGVNLDSYCRKVTFQHLTADGVANIGRTVELMAAAESLDAHRNAMTLRLHENDR